MKAWQIKNILIFGSVIYVLSLLVLFYQTVPDLTAKVASNKSSAGVTFTAAWDDVTAFATADQWPRTLNSLKLVPVSAIAAPASLSLENEALIRSAGFRVLWLVDDALDVAPFLGRLQDNDGLVSVGERALEKPLLLRALPELIASKHLFIPLFEFSPIATQQPLPSIGADNLIKGHAISTREMMGADPQFLQPRVMRAIESRWVRLLFIRFSPKMSLEQNIGVQVSLAEALRQKGYEVGEMSLFRRWDTGANGGFFTVDGRRWLIFGISLLTPLLGLLWAQSFNWRSASLCFISVSALSVLSGLVIHALGSVPNLVLMIQMVRGIKLQLLLPLAFSLLIFLNPKEIRAGLEQSLKIKHVVIAAGVFGVLLAVYLMRSGNFPIIPVTDSERIFRDYLDQLFVVRPRFKEFLIGHPLFMLGLVMRSRMRLVKNFYWDGRFILWVGMIGQISIINTFMHFHAPLGEAIVRTFNGLWIGFLVSLPLIYLFRKLIEVSSRPRMKHAPREKATVGSAWK